jgi:hypothetical protein
MAAFYAVTEKSIVTQSIVRCAYACPQRIVANFDRASDSVIENRCQPRLAPDTFVTNFRTVTEEAVVAKSMTWGVKDRVILLVTTIDRASDPIPKDRNLRRLAPEIRVTDFQAIAE